MRILGLHIENFGGLCDYTETFTEGLNVRQQPNGWGKSTLAVFIKAMLYGLPVSTKRSLLENERKRYTPWQGGVFGGSLDIEIGGESYRIERSFGAKESEDTLRVIALRTGQDADVAWARTPGEGLFGVDAAAYERSTYVSQRPEEMTKDGSVSIHTKLNRLVDATDDLANYDTAMERLDKRRRQLRHLTGGGGEIAEAEERLAALDRDMERCYAQRAVLLACRERMAELKDHIAKARTEAEDLRQALAREWKEREGRAVGARLEALLAEEAALEAILAECREALGGQEPSDRLIETVAEAVEREEQARRRMDEARLEAAEEAEIEALSARFRAGVPTEAQWEALRLAAKDYNRASVLAMDMESGEENRALDADPEEQYLEARGDLHVLREKRRAMETIQVGSKIRRVDPVTVILLVLAVAFAVGAVWMPVLWPGAAVCLAMALVFAAVHAKKNAKITAQAQENEQKLALLDEEIRQAELDLVAIEQAVRFARLWREAFADEPCPTAAEAALGIERLAAQSERLLSLLDKRKQVELSRRAARHALDEAHAHVLTLLRGLKGAPTEATKVVRFLTEISSRYHESCAHRERKQAEIAALRAQYQDNGALPDQKATGAANADVAALEERQREIARLLAQWGEMLAREEQTEVRLVSETEEMDALESEREEISAEVERMKDSLATIQSAEKYLKEAKERLSGRYLTTMQERFGRYLGAMTGEDAPVFTMDAQFRVKVREKGLSRDTDAFSTGKRDLIALCERFALVDAMFEGERPFLILDDPFTNLDDDTVERGAALIRQVAEHYQVLYLTCHSGRVIDGNEVGVR